MMTSITHESSVNVEPAALRVWVEARTVFLELADGRIVGFPADRFKILSTASNEQLQEVQLELNGFSRIGSNPLETLKRNIPGYGRLNQTRPDSLPFDFYE